MLILALLAVALIAGNLILPDPDPVKPVGRARVIDGDSLVVDGREIRLEGIDAPELAQSCQRDGNAWKCGEEAQRQLRFFVRGGDVACEGDEFDEHGRLLAVCMIGERNVNAWMVEEGWAVSYGNYQDQQAEAREKRRGLWQGSFERPRDWRAAHPRR
jgi:endonuclease YncB( thermonuclease family)